MTGKSKTSSAQRGLIFTCCLLLSGPPAAMAYRFPFFTMGFGFQSSQPGAESSLVRVNVITKFRDAKDTVEINGKLISDYNPTVTLSFSSTGIVLDPQGHILTRFLDYRWLDIQNDSTIEVSQQGQKWKGKLVGVDQRNGAAVIRIVGGKLKKTPTCSECKVKDGVTVVAPVSTETSQFLQAQIVSVGADLETPDPEDLLITVDRPFPDVGQPILTLDYRVFGFIAGQDPMGIGNVVYPISELIASAEKIIRKGGSIYAGWLGVYVPDSNPAAGPGVFVQDVEPDSPAQIAGLIPGDRLLKYNGKRIADSNQYTQLVERSQVGSKANLEILRQGNPMTITALIGTRRLQPNRDRLSFNLREAFGFPIAAIIQEAPPRNQKLLIGVDALLLDTELVQALQIPVPNGVLVTGVQQKSPAEKSGVLVGDIIESIDGQPITDLLSFTTLMQTHNWGPRVFLQVNRKGADLTIPVQLSNR